MFNVAPCHDGDRNFHEQIRDAIHSVGSSLPLSSPSFLIVLSRNCRESLTAGAAAGTLAEEVVSTVRTAKAFGTQDTLTSLYTSFVRPQYVAEERVAVSYAAGMGGFFFVVYAVFALG